MTRLNGESSVHIDRGRWLYRFALDNDSIAIYRARRAGQDLVPAEVWRALALLGVSDAFVVPVPGGWQTFVELDEGRQRWALETRASLAEAEAAAQHFMATLADAVVHAAQSRGAFGDKELDERALRVPDPGDVPAEAGEVESALSDAVADRAAGGWELIYSRQRAVR